MAGFSKITWPTITIAITLRSLAIYAETKVDFGDAMIVAAMEQQHSQDLYSFDTDFDGMTGTTRIEPGKGAVAA